MSRFEDGSYGSLKGIALIGKVLAGRCSMKYTRAAAGSGMIPEGMTPKTMDGPAGYVMDVKIAAVTNPLDGECQVTVQIRSDDVQSGFYATCIVLYAEDPDEGEVPYTYLSLENEPEWIRPASSIVGKLATFDLIAAVGEVDAVTAVIDPEAIATVGGVEEMISRHDKDPGAHADLLSRYARLGESGKIPGELLPEEIFGQGGAVMAGITIPSGAWAEETDGPGAYRADVACGYAAASHIPYVSVHGQSIALAVKCRLCGLAEAADGILRFWAGAVPEGDISAYAALFGPGTGGSTGGDCTLQPATAENLGGVKIGDGISAEPDGTISVDSRGLLEGATAPEKDVSDMLDDVLGPESQG